MLLQISSTRWINTDTITEIVLLAQTATKPASPAFRIRFIGGYGNEVTIYDDEYKRFLSWLEHAMTLRKPSSPSPTEGLSTILWITPNVCSD